MKEKLHDDFSIGSDKKRFFLDGGLQVSDLDPLDVKHVLFFDAGR